MIIEYPGMQATESYLLKTAIDVTPDDDHWQCDEKVWCEGQPCGDIECFPIGDCCCDTDYGDGKGADVEPCREFVEFCRFQLIATDKCSVFGNKNLAMSVRDRATEKLLLKERKAVEAALWGAVDAGCGPLNCSFSPEGNSELLCPENCMTPLDGLSLIEDALWCCTDTPFIHVPRPMVNYLKPYLEKDDDGCLRTCLGSYVIPGVGYDGSYNGECEPGCAVIYGTGPVKYLKGDICYTSDTDLEATNIAQNEVTVHAERAWGLWVDPCCGVKAANVVYCAI